MLLLLLFTNITLTRIRTGFVDTRDKSKPTTLTFNKYVNFMSIGFLVAVLLVKIDFTCSKNKPGVYAYSNRT